MVPILPGWDSNFGFVLIVYLLFTTARGSGLSRLIKDDRKDVFLSGLDMRFNRFFCQFHVS
jgi:hypothetical protein